MDGTYGEGLATEAEEPNASGEVYEETLPGSVEEGLPDEAEDVDPDAESEDYEWAEEHSPLPDEDPEAVLEEALTPGPELEGKPLVGYRSFRPPFTSPNPTSI
ncbi:MAG: hypothetical protein HS116_06400 [Planctomycetes bacterium]|nr:hypothetical protein [Planctomycetota bacterium]